MSSPLDRNVDSRHVLEHPVDDLLQVLLADVLGDRLNPHNGKAWQGMARQGKARQGHPNIDT